MRVCRLEEPAVSVPDWNVNVNVNVNVDVDVVDRENFYWQAGDERRERPENLWTDFWKYGRFVAWFTDVKSLANVETIDRSLFDMRAVGQSEVRFEV